MRSGVVVLLEPVIDDDLGLLGRCELFGIENLPAQCPVEALTCADICLFLSIGMSGWG